jgi:hypothetical protein
MCASTDLDNSLLDRAIAIGIVGAKAPSKPVPAALGNPLAANVLIQVRRNPTIATPKTSSRFSEDAPGQSSN